MKLEQLIYEMLTEGTGSHLCDSGGDNGRHWQRNQKKSLEDFRSEPEATLDGSFDCLEVTVSLFHHLTSGVIELDERCNVFNSEPMGNWNSDIYGVDNDQAEWLELEGFKIGRSWNTYNWDNNFSQILQGTDLTLETEYGEESYVLLQIHNGADARGGYTDAKLFKVDDWSESWEVVRDDCGFTVDVDVEGNGDYQSLTWCGEWINTAGSCADDSDLEPFIAASKETPLIGVICH